MKLFGYNGRILRVNLTNRTTSVETPDEKFYRTYLGGAGFVAYYLTKELKPDVDPLSPDNKLIFAAGPLTGIPLSGSGRHCIGAKSPLGNQIAKSEIGGFWGAEFMHAGYDAIVFDGKADKPVYLWIKDGEVQIKDASHLWGKPTKETQETLRAELGDNRIRVASIGPAGENLVRFACVINDLTEAAGRGGTGAVMGSKNLKAIAVRGTKPPAIAKPDELSQFRQWLTDNSLLWSGMHEFGTGFAMESYVTIGNTPIRNFRDGEFPNIKDITAITLKNTIRVGMEGCYGCIVRCKKIVKVDEPGMQIDPAYGGPEYEGLAALGNTCGVDNLKAICKANERCNAYSLDCISTGVSIAFAMECYEAGLLTSKDTGGIDLRFGNKEAMLQAVELIARREGIGDLLAEGVKASAEKIGKGSEKFAMHVKGLEVPMHDPRCKAGLGLGYIVNPHGADHCANLMDTNYAAPSPNLDELHPFGILEPLPPTEISPKKVQMMHYYRLGRLLGDCLVLCLFTPWRISQFPEMVKVVTGWDTGMVEMFKCTERMLALAQIFDIKQGLNPGADDLPDRFFTGRVGGPAAAKKVDREKLNKARDYYFRLMGWDAKGVPTPETLEALDIAWATTK